jgi:formylglycine-generating enzyme required for sulfatase activity
VAHVGSYEILGELGRGGRGGVVRARAPDGRIVALKMLLRPDPQAVARFERERRLLMLLGAPEGFVPMLDVGDTPQGPFYVMPLLSGGTLRKRLEGGPLSIGDTVALGITLATAMGRAHEKGIVHRDLKPDNILFDDQGRALIADLGIAKHFRRDVAGASLSVALTREGGMTGSAGYMAPEQITGKDVGPPADVFALGAILWECLAGEPVFVGDSMHAVLAKVISGEVSSVRDLRPETPRWLQAVIQRALRGDRAKRYRDGADLALALADGGRRWRRRLLLRGAAVAGAVAVVATAVGFAARADAPPTTNVPDATTSSISVAPQRPSTPGAPDWWSALAPDERPPLPLPKGVTFGEASGEYVNGKDGSVLVYVPAGSFQMGAAHPQLDEGNALPVHTVELSSYFLGKVELTNAKWEKFAKESGYATEAEQSGTGFVQPAKDGKDILTEGESVKGTSRLHTDEAGAPPPPPDHPVVQVTWDDARAYCAWAGLRLPTEAEWERAASWDARAKRARMHPWGDEEPGPGLTNIADARVQARWPNRHLDTGEWDDGFVTTAPVGSFPRGASPVGVHDMAGNVQEWVADGYDEGFYAHSPRKDPLCPPGGPGSSCCCRGPSWFSPPSFTMQRRFHYIPLYRSNELGFRVARNGR